jgi:hypothetical protein
MGADGAAQYKCKEKNGRTVYQQHPCPAGSDAAQMKGAQNAAPASAPAHAGPVVEPGLWETTIVLRPRQARPTQQELDQLGLSGFFVGRPMKTVRCMNDEIKATLAGSCAEQVAAQGGTCRREKSDNWGNADSKHVDIFTGNFRTTLKMEGTTTRIYKAEPLTQIDERSGEFRYLGPCKPGMQPYTYFYVNEKGEWVTEAQMRDELEAKAKGKTR